MTAAVHDLAAYRRKRAAALLVRAQRGDVCCYCGEPCDVRQRLAWVRENYAVAHVECWIRESGMETTP